MCGYLKLPCQYISLPVHSDSPSSPHDPRPSALCGHCPGASPSLEDSLNSAHTSAIFAVTPFEGAIYFLPGPWLTDPGTPPCHSWVSILGNSHTQVHEKIRICLEMFTAALFTVWVAGATWDSTAARGGLGWGGSSKLDVYTTRWIDFKN